MKGHNILKAKRYDFDLGLELSWPATIRHGQFIQRGTGSGVKGQGNLRAYSLFFL